MIFDIYNVIAKLSQRRKVFVSEADFQLEMAWVIKEEYPEAKVRLEYSPAFNTSMHIDILVIMNDKWIPIELKYKTKGCTKIVDGEVYNLKEHGAKDINCYLYLKDIQRVETIKEHVVEFEVGYTVFLTNQINYTIAPTKIDCIYKDFSLEDGSQKSGMLQWGKGAGTGTIKGNEKPIVLNGNYPIVWSEYSRLDDTNTGVFQILVNQIY